MGEDPAETGRKLFEEEEKQDQETAKQFDIKALVRKAGQVHMVKDPKIGVIKYTPLTTKDLFDINKIEDKDARARALVFRMLRKVSPDLTEDEINDWPQHLFTRILELLMADKSFFPVPTSPKDGSKSPSTLST